MSAAPFGFKKLRLGRRRKWPQREALDGWRPPSEATERYFGPGPFGGSVTGARVMPHFGQLPDLSDLTSGCIWHVQ